MGHKKDIPPHLARQIEDAIAADDLMGVFDLLDPYVKKPKYRYRKDIILLKARHSEIRRKGRTKISTNPEISILKNKLRADLLDLIEEMEVQ